MDLLPGLVCADFIFCYVASLLNQVWASSLKAQIYFIYKLQQVLKKDNVPYGQQKYCLY